MPKLTLKKVSCDENTYGDDENVTAHLTSLKMDCFFTIYSNFNIIFKKIPCQFT